MKSRANTFQRGKSKIEPYKQALRLAGGAEVTSNLAERALRSREADDAEIEEPYRRAMGSLIWLANISRPDIANAVRDVVRHMSNPNAEHWKAVVRILQYLRYHRGTRLDGLVLGEGERGELHVYVGSDYARDLDCRRSVSGVAVMFGATAISLLSRIQSCVTTSSSEAEYVAMGDAVKEAIYV